MSARGDALPALLLAFGAVLGGSVSAAAADLILAVTIDGRPQPGFGDFVERDGRLLARPDDLRAVGVTLPDDVIPDTDGLVALDEVPGLTYTFDPAEQTVAFGVAFGLLTGSDIRMRRSPAAMTPTTPTTALALDYDATLTRDIDGTLQWGSLVDARVSTPWGVGESTGFIRGDEGAPEIVRLDTWFETSLPESMITFRVGDAITGGLSWTRPIRFGGLAARRDFGVRPDLVTTPLPGFDGTAEVPSAVDVLVNGIRQGSYDVAPGPFHVGDVPVVTGSGQVTLVVRDALGRERLESFDYFASPKLLADDLFDGSVEVGRLRQGYGSDSFEYGPWIGSATVRWGATSWLTLEGHAEGARDLVSGGGGVVLGVRPARLRLGLCRREPPGGRHRRGHERHAVRRRLRLVQRLARPVGPGRDDRSGFCRSRDALGLGQPVARMARVRGPESRPVWLARRLLRRTALARSRRRRLPDRVLHPAAARRAFSRCDRLRGPGSR